MFGLVLFLFICFMLWLMHPPLPLMVVGAAIAFISWMLHEFHADFAIPYALWGLVIFLFATSIYQFLHKKDN